MRTIGFALALAASSFAFAFVAEAEWSHQVSYTRAGMGKTSIKLVEPAGGTVKVAVGEELKEDTIPTVIRLPNADAFYPVTVTSKDGATWSQKVEIKDAHVAELKLSHAQAPGAAAAKPSRKFIGSVSNGLNRCPRLVPTDVRLDFLRDGQKTREFTVQPGVTLKNVEVEAGDYEVRLFTKGRKDAAFVYWMTDKLSVGKDGWTFGPTCVRR